jgi:hypothetical protein
MGNIKSKKFYHNLTQIDKQKFIQMLISKYSDIEISSMNVRVEQISLKPTKIIYPETDMEISGTAVTVKRYKTISNLNYSIHYDDYDIYFCEKKELIDCLLKINRPFIISENYEYITIQFVYTNY